MTPTNNGCLATMDTASNGCLATMELIPVNVSIQQVSLLLKHLSQCQVIKCIWYPYQLFSLTLSNINHHILSFLNYFASFKSFHPCPLYIKLFSECHISIRTHEKRGYILFHFFSPYIYKSISTNNSARQIKQIKGSVFLELFSKKSSFNEPLFLILN